MGGNIVTSANLHSLSYAQKLDAWHLELAILRNLVDHILSELDGPDWMTSSAHIARDRFAHLVETFPSQVDEGQQA